MSLADWLKQRLARGISPPRDINVRDDVLYHDWRPKRTLTSLELEQVEVEQKRLEVQRMMKKNRQFLEKHSGSVKSIISTMPTPFTRSSPRLSPRLLVPQATLQDRPTTSHNEVAVENRGVTTASKTRTSPRMRRSNSVPTKAPAGTTTTEASNPSQACLTRPSSAGPQCRAKEEAQTSLPTAQPARAMERVRSRSASKPKTSNVEVATEEAVEGSASKPKISNVEVATEEAVEGSNDLPKTTTEPEVVAGVLEGPTEQLQRESAPVEQPTASDQPPRRLPKPWLSPRPLQRSQRQKPHSTKKAKSEAEVSERNIMANSCQKENLNENIEESNQAASYDNSAEVPTSKRTDRQTLETPLLRQRSPPQKGLRSPRSPLTENGEAKTSKQPSYRQRDGSRQRTLRQVNSSKEVIAPLSQQE